MTPGALAGFLGVAVSALVPAARAADKISCVAAHEAAQEFQQRNLLAQSREQLLFCSDPRCPRLVADDCQRLLAEIDRLTAPDDTEAPASAASDSREARPDEREAKRAHAEATAPASPVRASQSPATATAQPTAQQRVMPGRTAPHRPARATPSPLDLPLQDAPARRSRTEPWAPLLPGALAVAALSTAAYFGWSGLSAAQELGRRCSPACDPAEVSPVRRQLLIADLSLLAGIGLGSLTAWMIWNERAHGPRVVPVTSSNPRRETAGAGWSLVPRLGALQVEYGGRF